MKTTKNDITQQSITTAAKPMTENHWNALYERIRSVQNPRYFPNDESPVEILCAVCEREFIGGKHRTKCALCGG